nr:RusA family crossover junction endodeoxyribonuclease [Staphylococcus hyicus]MDP4464527.1 RusA family crossover junction endodeoxyribonuclease [Staphylococcus hyicus]
MDNLLKTILDAGNNLLWVDDTLIYEIRTFKKYAETARTVLTINEMEGD